MNFDHTLTMEHPAKSHRIQALYQAEGFQPCFLLLCERSIIIHHSTWTGTAQRNIFANLDAASENNMRHNLHCGNRSSVREAMLYRNYEGFYPYELFGCLCPIGSNFPSTVFRGLDLTRLLFRCLVVQGRECSYFQSCAVFVSPNWSLTLQDW